MPIALLVLIVVSAVTLAATWPGFNPKHIAIIGNHRVPSTEILRYARIAPQRSIWLQNTGAIARRIEAIPFVATASIHRIPPAVLRITVAERAPFAILRSGEESVVVDRALRVLVSASGEEREPVLVVQPGLALPPGKFVVTREALALRDAYEAMAARQIVPLMLAFDRYGGLVVTLPDGLRLLLGQENDLARKLTLVDAILTQVVHRQRRVAAIDLRAPATPVIVYR